MARGAESGDPGRRFVHAVRRRGASPPTRQSAILAPMRQTFALAVALVAGLGVSASCGGSGGGGGSNGFMLGEGGGGSGGSGGGGDLTCAQAAASKSYIGCDYWPTVTANSVWSVFDYTVVVANTQSTTAMVTVTGPGGVDQMVTVL